MGADNGRDVHNEKRIRTQVSQSIRKGISGFRCRCMPDCKPFKGCPALRIFHQMCDPSAPGAGLSCPDDLSIVYFEEHLDAQQVSHVSRDGINPAAALQEFHAVDECQHLDALSEALQHGKQGLQGSTPHGLDGDFDHLEADPQ